MTTTRTHFTFRVAMLPPRPPKPPPPEAAEASTAAPRRIARTPTQRLRGDARGRDGGVREDVAAGVGAMTNHDDMPTRFPALVWAVIFTVLLVAAVAIFALVLIR
jgi:hypothetical protein